MCRNTHNVFYNQLLTTLAHLARVFTSYIKRQDFFFFFFGLFKQDGPFEGKEGRMTNILMSPYLLLETLAVRLSVNLWTHFILYLYSMCDRSDSVVTTTCTKNNYSRILHLVHKTSYVKNIYSLTIKNLKVFQFPKKQVT